jgi:hypothetical protein
MVEGEKYVTTHEVLFTKKMLDIPSNPIPFPKQFPLHSFPQSIKQHIEKTSKEVVSYQFSLFDKRTIRIYFVLEKKISEQKIKEYVHQMAVWLYMLHKYASPTCSQDITIYIYLTSCKKKLPEFNTDVLEETHVNSAFTTSCAPETEIVVFRKEEWFKVFLHETFHSFGLDFSDMNNDIFHRKILTLFPVSSEVNLFEAYTEFWACLLNCLFFAYRSLDDNKNIDPSEKIKEFLSLSEIFFNMERRFKCFQMVKVLNYMGLQYKDLFGRNGDTKKKYREKTNVLAYFVINASLMDQYEEFLHWCEIHNQYGNVSLLQFKKTTQNQFDFYQFIEKHYQCKSLLQNVSCMEKALYTFQKQKKNIVLSTMRMTIFDFE